jgi:hypothetical protein
MNASAANSKPGREPWAHPAEKAFIQGAPAPFPAKLATWISRRTRDPILTKISGPEASTFAVSNLAESETYHAPSSPACPAHAPSKKALSIPAKSRATFPAIYSPWRYQRLTGHVSGIDRAIICRHADPYGRHVRGVREGALRSYVARHSTQPDN